MIACLYPRPLISLSEGFAPHRCELICRLVAVDSGSATCAAAFIARYWSAVRVLLAPQLYFIFFSTFDTPLAHLDVVLDFSFRELAVLSENDIETQAEYAQPYKYKRREKYLHNKSINSVGRILSRRNLYQIQFLS